MQPIVNNIADSEVLHRTGRIKYDMLDRREFIAKGFGGLLAVPLAGCSSLVSGGDWQISACKYGEAWLPESWILPGGDKTKKVPISLMFHLIEFEGHYILADVGCDNFELFGEKATNFVKPAELLRSHGIAPDAIEMCFISHHHADHVGSLNSFMDAAVFIQEQEAEKCKSLLARHAGKVTVFADQVQTFGGKVVQRRVGGHTAGHAVLEIGAGRGKKMVIAGDACYSPVNIARRIPTATTQNAAESQAFIERYANGDYAVLLAHDPSIKVPNGIIPLCTA